MSVGGQGCESQGLARRPVERSLAGSHLSRGCHSTLFDFRMDGKLRVLRASASSSSTRRLHAGHRYPYRDYFGFTATGVALPHAR